MGWVKNTFTSSIGKKLIMSLTGIFLILFLVEHLIGNLLLLKSDGGAAFNEFAHFMKHNPLIMVGEVVLFLGFIFHIIDGIMLVRSNNNARPVKYAVQNKSKVTSWTSKLMGPFGIILLIFLIIHLYDFFRYKYFAPVANMEGTDISDLAQLVYIKFTDPLYVAFYVISMLVVGFHIHHGFQSAFQTLGLNHKKYTPFIKALGFCFSVVITVGMSLIPLIIYYKHITLH